MGYKTVAIATIILHSLSSIGMADEQGRAVDSNFKSKADKISKECDVKLDKASAPTKTEINNGDGSKDN